MQKTLEPGTKKELHAVEVAWKTVAVALFICLATFAVGGVVTENSSIVKREGTVVAPANRLGANQAAVDVGGVVKAYPLPEGVSAVVVGQKVTVWSTTQGTPTTPPLSSAALVAVAGILILAIGAAAFLILLFL